MGSSSTEGQLLGHSQRNSSKNQKKIGIMHNSYNAAANFSSSNNGSRGFFNYLWKNTFNNQQEQQQQSSSSSWRQNNSSSGSNNNNYNNKNNSGNSVTQKRKSG